MRRLVALALLLCACSSKSNQQDAATADAVSDLPLEVAADRPIQCPGTSASGFPCCYFAESTTNQRARCDPAECTIILDAGAQPADGGDPSCLPCDDGFACAIVCPSPLGGCGGPPTCCRVQQ